MVDPSTYLPTYFYVHPPNYPFAYLLPADTHPLIRSPGAESIEAALKGADVIVVPAGVPRKPGMTRDDLFNINATIVKTIAEASAKVRSGAALGVGLIIGWLVRYN